MKAETKTADISVSYESGVLVIRLRGEIDHHSARPLRESIDRELFYYRAATVIMDMSQIGFMDSAGLGLILGRYTRIKELDGTLRLLNPTEEITRLMELSGADKLIPSDRSETGDIKGMMSEKNRAANAGKRKDKGGMTDET